MEKVQRKPQIRVNRYPNGFWVIIYGKGGVLSGNRAEGIKKLMEQFPGDYDIIDVNAPDKNDNPHMVKPEPVIVTSSPMA